MRLKLVEVRGDYGYYLLPARPTNPYRVSRAVIKVGPREYYEVRNAFVDFIPGIGWVLPLPFIKDEIELIYLE